MMDLSRKLLTPDRIKTEYDLIKKTYQEAWAQVMSERTGAADHEPGHAGADLEQTCCEEGQEEKQGEEDGLNGCQNTVNGSGAGWRV